MLCFFSTQTHAIYYGARDSAWDHSSEKCYTKSLHFNPFQNSNDIDWEVANPYCLALYGSLGAAMVASDIASYFACDPTNFLGMSTIAAEKAGNKPHKSPFITPTVAQRIVSLGGRCGKRISELSINTGTQIAACSIPVPTPACPLAIAEVVKSGKDISWCCTSVAAYYAIVGTFLGVLGERHRMAQDAYEHARICGHNWNTWKYIDENGEPTDRNTNTIRVGKYFGSYQRCLEDTFTKDADDAGYNFCKLDKINDAHDLKNKNYREYLYGGVEYEDNSSRGCENPPNIGNFNREKSLGYDSNSQRYYMRGAGVAGNYACHRFLLMNGLADTPAQEKAIRLASQKAYECCKRKSQNAICIENNQTDLVGKKSGYRHKFCEIGDKCNPVGTFRGMEGVIFEPFMSKKRVNFICARSFSSCPYNHPLGGGTEDEDPKLDSEGNPTPEMNNYCQIMKHCQKIPVLPFVKISDLHGAYISSTCKDFKGDSQNVYGFNGGIFPISARGFSSPIVQCFKETMENLFLHKAGETKCMNPDELPDKNQQCSSGYFYQKGHDLQGLSFFMRVQEKLKDIIKMCLSLAVVGFGISILTAADWIKKKQLLTFALKVGLVVYFALGDGWQKWTLNGILGTSSVLSSIMMQVDYGDSEEKQDGCKFPRFDYSDENEATRYANPKYKEGSDYLAVWDTLDCKLARAFGFAPEASVPNLVKMIFAGIITKGLGIIFIVGVLCFAFFFLSLVLRGMQIFIVSITALILLIYFSPITIVCAMFQKTKGIFDSWLKKIIGLCLQPMITFAYFGILIAMFDTAAIGSARFEGDGRSVPKKIVCTGQAKNDSIYCIFKVAEMKNFSGLEPIGIGLSMLTSLNQEKLSTIIKAAFLMFMFWKFMDKIGSMAEELVGGPSLPTDMFKSASEMASGAMSVLKGIKERGEMGMKKWAPRAASKAYGMTLGKAKNAINTIGNRGQAGQGQATSGGSHSVGSGDEGADKRDGDGKGEGSDKTGDAKDGKGDDAKSP
jgi:type IV secretory pathway VirB6-like protein